jgi:hypothetical protein
VRYRYRACKKTDDEATGDDTLKTAQFHLATIQPKPESELYDD